MLEFVDNDSPTIHSILSCDLCCIVDGTITRTINDPKYEVYGYAHCEVGSRDGSTSWVTIVFNEDGWIPLTITERIPKDIITIRSICDDLTFIDKNDLFKSLVDHLELNGGVSQLRTIRRSL